MDAMLKFQMHEFIIHTFIVGRNFLQTSSLLSAIVLFSNKLMKKKNDAVAAGPYVNCSNAALVIPVRKFDPGNTNDVSFTHPYSVGATYNDPYRENLAHFFQSYVSDEKKCKIIEK